MKEEIEEPVKKSWKVFALLLFILLILIGLAILLGIWYFDNIKDSTVVMDTTRVLLSGSFLLLLIVILSIIVIRFYKPSEKKKKTKKKSIKSGKPRKKVKR